jgi:Tfp pilus assembly protein PilF
MRPASRPSATAGTRGFQATAALLTALLLAALAGCATPPRRLAGPRPPGWQDLVAMEHAAPDIIPAALTKARALVLRGSPSTLAAAARALTSPAVRGWEGRNLAGLGRGLYAALYPDLPPNPFPVESVSLVYGNLLRALESGSPVDLPERDETDFYRITLACLAVLRPASVIPGAGLDELEAAAARAEEISGGGSVLPPYVRAQIAARRAAAARGFAGGPLEQAAVDGLLSIYRECLDRAPDFTPALRDTARLLAAAGRAAEAVPFLGSLAALEPRDPGVLLDLARTSYAAADYQGALDASARALLVVEDPTEASLLRARAFAASGDWYRGLRVLQIFLSRSPDSRDALVLKARLLADSARESDQALQMLADARVRFPQDAEIAELEGDLLLRAGRHEQGIASLNRALELQPDRASTLRLLIRDAMRGARWAQAQKYTDRLPVQAMTAEDLGAAYSIQWSLGDFPRAAELARRLTQTAPGSASQLLLIRALHAVGGDEDAAPLIRQALDQRPSQQDRSALLTLRAALQRRADPSAALDSLRAALQASPDNFEALVAISDMLAEAREYRKAAFYLSRAAVLAPEEPGLKSQVTELQKQAGIQK